MITHIHNTYTIHALLYVCIYIYYHCIFVYERAMIIHVHNTCNTCTFVCVCICMCVYMHVLSLHVLSLHIFVRKCTDNTCIYPHEQKSIRLLSWHVCVHAMIIHVCIHTYKSACMHAHDKCVIYFIARNVVMHRIYACVHI